MLSKVIAQANIDHAEKWFERADKMLLLPMCHRMVMPLAPR